eukprot:31199-Pelagomonas_calceolata.AAC.1
MEQPPGAHPVCFFGADLLNVCCFRSAPLCKGGQFGWNNYLEPILFIPYLGGQFGWNDYLEPILHNITVGGDYYLVANDFVPYLEAQLAEVQKTTEVRRLLIRPSVQTPMCLPGLAWCIAEPGGLGQKPETASQALLKAIWEDCAGCAVLVEQNCRTEKVDEAYKDQSRWNKMSIMSTAGSGKFSTDRTISNYAKVRGFEKHKDENSYLPPASSCQAFDLLTCAPTFVLWSLIGKDMAKERNLECDGACQRADVCLCLHTCLQGFCPVTFIAY